MESSIADDGACIEIHLNRATVWARVMGRNESGKASANAVPHEQRLGPERWRLYAQSPTAVQQCVLLRRPTSRINSNSLHQAAGDSDLGISQLKTGVP